VSNAPVKDAELLAAARAGAPEAIEALLESYQERVFGFGLRMCGNREDAEDVLQDTLLAAATGMRDFRGDSLKQTLAICARLPRGPVPAAVKDSVRAALRAALSARS
jgi:hypothetical protein